MTATCLPLSFTPHHSPSHLLSSCVIKGTSSFASLAADTNLQPPFKQWLNVFRVHAGHASSLLPVLPPRPSHNKQKVHVPISSLISLHPWLWSRAEHPVARAGVEANPIAAAEWGQAGQRRVKSQLKSSLDALSGSLLHHARGCLAFMTLNRKPSLLFEFLYEIVW